MVDLRFGADGLLPVAVQDARSGAVLMVAYMNRQALERTLARGEAWYWSRSRGSLWRKGETSGHVQRLHSVRVDCDGDALLLLVQQVGPACHTGRVSCFFRDIAGEEAEAAPPDPDILQRLFAVVKARRAEMPGGSYTAALFRRGREHIAQRAAEEMQELIQAVLTEGDQRVSEEAADLLYHTWVLLAARGVELDAVREELERRRGR